MSPETYLHKGDRLRLVTYEEAREICGELKIGPYGERYFIFPETGVSIATGAPYTLSLNEEFVRENGGRVLTITEVASRYVGPHIHYYAKSEEGVHIPGLMTFCPTMFSGYEDEGFEPDPLDRMYVEDLFSGLFGGGAV